MNVKISKISEARCTDAINIFSGAFADDPLFFFAFPDDTIRKIQTRIMYEFVVRDMVPLLGLKMAGAYTENNMLVGCIIYSTPERKQWGEHMNTAIEKMRAAAKNERIGLIGQFAMLEGYKPEGPHFYGNELAVKDEYRNLGIGKALCQYLIDDCNGHPTAKGIAIDTANKHNVAMYERWGWKLESICDFYSIKKYFMWRNK